MKIPDSIYLESLQSQSLSSYIEFYEDSFLKTQSLREQDLDLLIPSGLSPFHPSTLSLFCIKIEIVLRICKILEDHCDEEPILRMN